MYMAMVLRCCGATTAAAAMACWLLLGAAEDPGLAAAAGGAGASAGLMDGWRDGLCFCWCFSGGMDGVTRHPGAVLVEPDRPQIGACPAERPRVSASLQSASPWRCMCGASRRYMPCTYIHGT